MLVFWKHKRVIWLTCFASKKLRKPFHYVPSGYDTVINASETLNFVYMIRLTEVLGILL